MTYYGTCHCGATEWTVELEEEAKHILCHCNACKLIGGGEFTLNLVAPQSAVKLTKGTLSKYTYKGDSGNPTHCYFCPTCTAHPYHDQTIQEGKFVVRSGLLKTAKDLSVAGEIYGKDRYTWQPEIAHTFETTPPS